MRPTKDLQDVIDNIDANTISLSECRSNLNEIDELFIKLLKKRMDETIKIGIYKAHHSLQAEDPKRENQQNLRIEDICKEADIEHKEIIRLFTLIREETKQVHKEIKAHIL